MPCYTIRTTTVDLNNIDPKVLDAALTAAGHTRLTMGLWEEVEIAGKRVLVRLNGTKVDVRLGAGVSNAEVAAHFKRLAANHVVTTTAKKFGWQVQRNATNPNKLSLKK